MSNSLQTHESQHARPPCPSPTLGVYSNSCPSSQWCHPAISSSVVPFSSCPQPLPASGSLPMSQLFTWGGQSIGVSASASVLAMNTQDWPPSGWTGWISLQSKGLSRVFSNTTVQKHQFFGAQLSSQSNSHIHTWQHITVIQIFRIFVSNLGKYLSSVLYMISKILGNVCFLGQRWIFPSGSVVKNLPSDSRRRRRLWVHSLDWEDPLKEELVSQPRVLAWSIPWMEGQGGTESDLAEHALARLVRHSFCGGGAFLLWCLCQRQCFFFLGEHIIYSSLVGCED